MADNDNPKNDAERTLMSPIYLSPGNRRIVVFGGGKVALRKCQHFEGFHITVVSPEILPELKDLADGHVTDGDMENSLRALNDGYHSVGDTPEDLDGWAYLQVCSSRFENPEETAARIAAVTKEQVVAAAQRVTLDTVFFLRGDGEEDDEA